MAKLSKPTYSHSWYTPHNIRQQMKIDPAAVRKEYTRLRDISQKRLKRLGASEWADSKAYTENVGKFPILKDLRNDTDLVYKLSDLERFVTADRASVSGLNRIRKESIQTLHEHDYTFVTQENYRSFGKFMEEYRFQKMDELYDSGDAADSYYITEVHKIPPEQLFKDFEFWLQRENIDIALSMKASKGKSKGSARRLRDRIAKKTGKRPGKKKRR